MKYAIILSLNLWLGMMAPLNLKSQHYFRVPENVENNVKVHDLLSGEVLFPWTGGMNSCQFGEIDLNLDGVKDLFVFDRMGNRIMTFVNGGQPSQVDYSYSPEFITHFPDLYDWVILKDYNQDGLEDIFTYAKDYPGIVVYRNVSMNTLAFELEVYPFLTSLQGGSQVNILTTNVDYPGIEDIDQDGDLDILTFWGLGSFVEYHQNQSVELYGHSDSLVFVEVTQCWGRFAESDESNVIYLDTCMGGQGIGWSSSKVMRHTGSTFLLLDLEGDGDQDLLLGDVDYPGLIALINGGSPDSAYMISQDPLFPSYDKPVNLFSMPAAAILDVNNDGLKDMLISPFDPSLVTSANFRSVWLYGNTGSPDQPVFSFFQQDFLQEDMIDVGSGAYPVLEDYNGDGLMDLFVGNYGYYIYSYYDPAGLLHSVYWSNIALYENTGSAENPKFTRITHDYAGLHGLEQTAYYPTFGDLDGDADRDLVLGIKNGTLILLENTQGPGGTPEYADPVYNYQSIDVGEYSAPQLWDLDGDGLLDLVVGEMNGNLNYYRNTGTLQQAQFELVTDSLGQVNVTDYNLSYTGYSTPCFFHGQDGKPELLVGSEQGKVFYFRDIEGNLEGAFEESDSLFVLIGDNGMDFSKGIRTGSAIGELNGDDHQELIIGNYSGGLQYFKGIDQPPVSAVGETTLLKYLKISPNPATDEIRIFTGREEKDFLVDIFDLSGRRVVRSYAGKNKGEVSVADLLPGLYLVRCHSSGPAAFSLSGKFLKTGPR